MILKSGGFAPFHPLFTLPFRVSNGLPARGAWPDRRPLGVHRQPCLQCLVYRRSSAAHDFSPVFPAARNLAGVQSEFMHVPLTPIRCLYRGVDLYGKKIGVVCGARRFTYAEFGERCERLAAGLLAIGVQPGDRVAYLSFNNHQLLEGYFGVPLAGAIVMPLNVRLTAAELTGIVNHAEPRVIVFESEFQPVVEELRRACPAIERAVEIGEQYEDLLSRGRIQRPDPFSIDETAIAELFYTSGSTGTPKGVMLSHRTLYLHALYVANIFCKDDSGVELHTIPLFHANGWGRPQACTFMGLRHVMVRRFEPAQVLRLIEEERVTGMSLVPTMANLLLNCPELGRYDTSSLQTIMTGGAASSPELVDRLERALHCHVEAGYGLTETSPVATAARRKSTVTYAGEADRLRRLAMTGWPMPGCEIRVVDLHMNEVARDMQAVGEVVIRGDIVMDGYYKEPQATAAAMTEGWLHTGDMAVWDEENYISIVDRKKDIIVSGGENISSIEVERGIAAHPAVLECAVVSAPDAQWGEVPAAWVVVKPGQQLDEAQLREFLESRLAKFKMPRRLHFSSDPLPKTGTGKILKRELREALWAGKERRIQG
jgi:fatty-acyl-CoA synthase